jgi:hypothetical protein
MTKVIRVRHDENRVDVYKPKFVGTLGEAKTEAKRLHDNLRHLCKQVVFEEVNVQSDKAGLLAALDGEPIVSIPFRTWGITSRGALKEE